MVLMKHQEFAWTSLAGVQESALFSLLLSVTVSALFVNCALDEFNIANALIDAWIRPHESAFGKTGPWALPWAEIGRPFGPEIC